MGCSFSDQEWTLATLSTKLGGLGLRKTELHSPAAFLSSQTACRDLCQKLDPKYTWNPSNMQTDYFRALTDYNSRVNAEKQMENIGDPCPRQQTLSQNIDEKTLREIRESHSNDPHYLAHLNLITTCGAGAWLHAMPSRALATSVDPLLFRTMIQRRLRVPIFDTEFHCRHCDEIMDKFGDHCLTCSCGGDRTKRHNHLRNEAFFFINSIGLNPELERPGLLQPGPLDGTGQENGLD